MLLVVLHLLLVAEPAVLFGLFVVIAFVGVISCCCCLHFSPSILYNYDIPPCIQGIDQYIVSDTAEARQNTTLYPKPLNVIEGPLMAVRIGWMSDR